MKKQPEPKDVQELQDVEDVQEPQDAQQEPDTPVVTEKRQETSYMAVIMEAASNGSIPGMGMPRISKPFIRLIACGILAIVDSIKKNA